MNGASTTSTNLTDAPGSAAGVGGESGEIELNRSAPNNQQGPALPAVVPATAETSANFAEVKETAGGLTRVDSLTLALETIRARQAAAVACLGSPTSCVHSILHKRPDAVFINANSNDKASSCGSSGGEEDSHRKRASSLKLRNRKSDVQQTQKAVRFADAMGLDLVLVRQVFDLDSPPVIPPQALRDLVLPPSDDEFSGDEDVLGEGKNKYNKAADKDSAEKSGQQPRQHLYLSPSFAQPGSAPNFSSRVTAQKVVLEKAYYHMATPASTSVSNVRGLVRVANLGFEKAVRVKATFDAWLSSVEVGADYQPGGFGGSDQFAFSVALPEDLKVGDRVAFCVAYSVNGQTYWDSNFGDNYSFHCVALNSTSRGLSVDQEHALARYI